MSKQFQVGVWNRCSGGILFVSVIRQNIFGLVGAFARWVRSGMGTETTSGLRSASVVAEQKSTGLLATHTDVLKTHKT